MNSFSHFFFQKSNTLSLVVVAVLLLMMFTLKKHKMKAEMVGKNKDVFMEAAEAYEKGMQEYTSTGDLSGVKNALVIVERVGYTVNRLNSTDGFVVFTPSDLSGNVVICITDTSDQNSFSYFFLKNLEPSHRFMHNFYRVKQTVLKGNQKIDLIGGKIAHMMHMQLIDDSSLDAVHYVDGTRTDHIVDKTLCYFESMPWC